jgi:hypothetical protein
VERRIVGNARSLFENVGLDIAAASIRFHDSKELCRDGLGVIDDDQPEPVVEICVVHNNPGIRAELQQRILVHELSHLWLEEHLTHDAKRAVMDLWGIDEWTSRDAPWQTLGIERAAETMAWNLYVGDTWFDVRIGSGDCPERTTAFLILTGIDRRDTCMW